MSVSVSMRLQWIVSAVALFATVVSAADDRAVKAYKPKLAEVKAQRGSKNALPSSRAQLGPTKEFWLSPVSSGELSSARPKAGLTLASVHRSGVEEMLTRGEWVALPAGRKAFRASVRSPGAKGIRVHFQDFAVGEGKVWLHNGELESTPVGPYTAKGPFGDGDFWSEVVFGEALVIEYEPDASARQELPFQVAELSHVLINLVPEKRVVPAASLASPGEFEGPAATLPDAKILRAATTEGRSAALSCHLDVTCYPQWADAAKSVARYLFETDGGGALCTGALVNTRNSSGKLYFLTADHCVSSNAEARSVQTFWMYQTSTCDGPAPSLRNAQTRLGATLLTNGGGALGDYSLLELLEAPDGVVFAGWNPSEHPIGAAVTGIHHPTGDYKRISFGSRSEAIQQRGLPQETFYTITWNRGITEGGSSGSPIFNDNGQIVGTLTGGPRPPQGQTECDLRPAFDWYGRFSAAYPAIQSYLEERQVGPTPPPSGNVGTALNNNTPRAFAFGPVETATLFGGENVFRIEVPQGATRLEIRVRTQTPNADIDLYVRRESPPSVANQRVQADFGSSSDSGDETVVITPTSTPGLQAGTYYIALALFTPGVRAEGTVTAIVSTGSTPPPTGGGQTLTSGASRNWTFGPVDAPTLFGGDNAFRIDVPQGATRLEIRLATSTSGADADLFVRFGQAPGVVDGQVQADFSSAGDTGDETIVITPSSNPPLRAGTYYIAIALFTRGIRAQGTLVATLTGSDGSNTTATQLVSGAVQRFTLDPVAGPALVRTPSFRITVPQGASRLRIALRTSTPDADLDLHVRLERPPEVSDGRVVADHSSQGAAGDEDIAIDAGTTPPLRAGTYFVSLAVFTAGRQIEGTVTAFVDTASTAPPARPTVLTSGAPASFAYPARSSPTLFTGNYGFRVEVPEGATSLTVRLSTVTPRADLDLYIRRGEDVALVDGDVVADVISEGPTGVETITISRTTTPALQSGTYYIGVGVFAPNTEITGTITATVERAPTGAGPSGASVLTPGQVARWSLEAVTRPTLFNATPFRVDVDNISRLEIQLTTDTPGADVDLHVRYGAPPEVQNGRVIADASSTGLTGNEVVTLSSGSRSGLRSGTYWIALAVHTTGMATEGTLLATTTGAAPQSESRLKQRSLAAGEASSNEALIKQSEIPLKKADGMTQEALGDELLLKDKLQAQRE